MHTTCTHQHTGIRPVYIVAIGPMRHTRGRSVEPPRSRTCSPGARRPPAPRATCGGGVGAARMRGESGGARGVRLACGWHMHPDGTGPVAGGWLGSYGRLVLCDVARARERAQPRLGGQRRQAEVLRPVSAGSAKTVTCSRGGHALAPSTGDRIAGRAWGRRSRPAIPPTATPSAACSGAASEIGGGRKSQLFVGENETNACYSKHEKISAKPSVQRTY